MEFFCHFHPDSPAKWQCHACQLYFDNACIPSASLAKQTKGEQILCPACKGKLSFLATEAALNNSQQLFTHSLFACFKAQPLLLMLCSVLIASLIPFLELNPMLSFLLCVSSAFFLCFHYGRQLIFSKRYSIAARNKKTQRIKYKHQDTSEKPDLKTSLQLAALASLLCLLPLYVFYSIHWFAGIVLISFSALLLPLLMVLISHASSSDGALNIKETFKALKHFKSALILQSLSLYLGGIVLSDFAFQHSTLLVSLMISSGAASLTLLFLFNSHARIYQLLAQKYSLSSTTETVKYSKNRVSENHSKIQHSVELDQALKTGQYELAAQILENLVKRNPQSMLRRQQLYLLLSELNDLKKLAYYADAFLYWMAERNKFREASQFVYRLRKANPEFVLEDIDLMAKLAKGFNQKHKYALVLWLAESCGKRFKPNESLARIFLQTSQALVTHYHDLTKAEEYLLFVIKNCAQFPSAEAAKALLFHLQNNQSREQELRE